MSARRNLDRRCFLRGLAAASLLPAAGLELACGSPSREEPGLSGSYWVSAQGDDEASWGLVALPTREGAPLFVTTDFRGHDVARHPTRPSRVVLFGRRPANRSAVIDLEDRRIAATIEALPDHTFQGHGFFSRDGALLCTAEAHRESGDGKLVLRETGDYSATRVIETGGIGPHEVALMPDGATAVVANGGLLTRPETGREVLNLATMDSSLCYVDLATGELLEQHRVAEPKSSIRHLDVTADGTVALGIQLQREALTHQDPVPLTGTHRRGSDIRLFEDGAELLPLLNDYVGSVAVCTETRVAGFTSPRGNIALFWDVDSGKHLAAHELADCCGLSASGDGETFALSSSLGQVRVLSVTDLREKRKRRRVEPIQWDNHMIEITFPAGSA